MNQVHLGLGSNVGNRYQNIRSAIEMLENHKKINLIKESNIYQTTPYGYIEQPDFLNNVIHISTSLSPFEMLDYIHEIENILGRKREIHWGPRTIDIDIILFGDTIIKEEALHIPHPYIKERLFVLKPLSELYDGVIPGESLSVNEMIKRVDRAKGVVSIWRKQVDG